MFDCKDIVQLTPRPRVRRLVHLYSARSATQRSANALVSVAANLEVEVYVRTWRTFYHRCRTHTALRVGTGSEQQRRVPWRSTSQRAILGGSAGEH